MSAAQTVAVGAARMAGSHAMLIGLLPVPHGFDPQHPIIRFTDETLEVRILGIYHRDAR